MIAAYFLIGLLIIAVIVVWFLMRDKDGKLPWQSLPENPWYKLEKEYREGRIDQKEYESRKEDLLKKIDHDESQ